MFTDAARPNQELISIRSDVLRQQFRLLAPFVGALGTVRFHILTADLSQLPDYKYSAKHEKPIYPDEFPNDMLREQALQHGGLRKIERVVYWFQAKSTKGIEEFHPRHVLQSTFSYRERPGASPYGTDNILIQALLGDKGLFVTTKCLKNNLYTTDTRVTGQVIQDETDFFNYASGQMVRQDLLIDLDGRIMKDDMESLKFLGWVEEPDGGKSRAWKAEVTTQSLARDGSRTISQGTGIAPYSAESLRHVRDLQLEEVLRIPPV